MLNILFSLLLQKKKKKGGGRKCGPWAISYFNEIKQSSENKLFQSVTYNKLLITHEEMLLPGQGNHYRTELLRTK